MKDDLLLLFLNDLVLVIIYFHLGIHLDSCIVYKCFEFSLYLVLDPLKRTVLLPAMVVPLIMSDNWGT